MTQLIRKWSSRLPAGSYYALALGIVVAGGAASRTQFMGNPRALAVDDEPDIRGLRTITLERMGADPQR